MNSAHSDLTVGCCTETGTTEGGHPEYCGTELTYEDHYVGMARKPNWEGDGLRLRCPDCREDTIVCPVCHGGGWFRGETTNEMLACHVCNLEEYYRQAGMA